MWELAVITLVVLLLVLILLIVACWITSNNCCRKNKRHLHLLEARMETGLASLQAAQTVCCTKAFLTSVGGATVDRLSGLLKVITWDSQTMNELPDGPPAGWTPVFSTIDDSLIGWTVPLSGTYFVEYETLIATGVAAAVMIVNGQLLLRSLSALSGTLTSPQLMTQQLHKSFLVNLAQGDIVSIVIFNLSGPGITPPVATGEPGRYLHTLSLDLRDAASQSTDQGTDANPTPIILAPTPASFKNETGEESVETKVAVKNVEQWATSDCVSQALTDASSCATGATDVSEQLNCIDTALKALALCGLSL
jgi:hypothetical protein